MQHDRAEQVGSEVPSQRTDPEPPGPTAAAPVPPVTASAAVRPASVASPDEPAAGPQPRSEQRGVDETVVLPAFVTGKREPEPKSEPHRPQPGEALPPSERGMLIFVAALLGVGTLAVVTVLGLGGFSSAKPSPPHAPPSAVASVYPSPTPVDAPSASPAAAPPASASLTPRRTSSPRALGTLTANDPAAYCTYKKAGRVHMREDGTWVCVGSPGHDGFLFTPADVCKWRYLRTNATAVVGNPADPTTWKCYA